MAKLLLWERLALLLAAFLVNLICTNAFMTQKATFSFLQRNAALSSSSSAQEDGNTSDPLASMRSLLESSWNVETMGTVPTNAESAAETAANSLLTAMERGQSSASFLIDILLPQYDISQGSNLYDEVLAVEFCVALANRLEGKTAIVVRDDKSLQTVSKIFDLRERDRLKLAEDLLEEEDDEEDEEEDDMDDVEFYDDFAELGSIGDTAENEGSDAVEDVDSFRQQLMSTWDEQPAADKPVQEPAVREDSKAAPSGDLPKKRYRLTSMLGDASNLSTGADMQSKVIKAVADNAQPHDDEDTLIILSAASPEEMIGVRGLVGKFGAKKTIIMVNCKLDPLPRELNGAEMVYSILPLLARSTVSEANIFGSEPKDEPKPPKVVLLRRYPRDWEVHIDAGDGFELAASVPASQVGRSGPPMQWIAGHVKSHLQARLS